MFSRVAFRLSKPAVSRAVGLPARVALQTRLMSQHAVDGSMGRKMPVHIQRATAPVANLEATFTIRVRLVPEVF
jgi:carbamoyl-phosphate synthase small subunit